MKKKKKESKVLVSSEKMLENYQKPIKVNTTKYNMAIMDISNKIALAKPQMLYTKEQITKLVHSTKLENEIQSINEMGLDKMSRAIGEIVKQQVFLYNSDIIQQMTSSMSRVISQIVEVQKQFMTVIAETISINVNPAFKVLFSSLEEAKNNPDSLLNWMNYYNKMSEFFWIMPYKITTEELHEILKNVTTEKEFDKYINRYFNKSKVDMLIEDIRNMLSNKNQRKVFDQIIIAYRGRSYALASIGITTMIDNFLSYYLIDKGCTSRLKLFEPIIEDLKLKRENSDFSFIVMMVNSNINLLYEQIEFNNKISINTNKKSRRNPISHGKSYSYKKIDTIMLLNTMYYLLVIQNELKRYRNSLYRKKKEFYIPEKEERIKIIEKIRSKKEEKNKNVS